MNRASRRAAKKGLSEEKQRSIRVEFYRQTAVTMLESVIGGGLLAPGMAVLGRIIGFAGRTQGKLDFTLELEVVAEEDVARNLDRLAEVYIGMRARYSWSSREFRSMYQVSIGSAWIDGTLVVEVPVAGGEVVSLVVGESDHDAALIALSAHAGRDSAAEA